MKMQEAINNINRKWKHAQENGKLSFNFKIDNGRVYTVKHYETLFASMDDGAFYVYDDQKRIVCRDVSNTEDLACMFMNLNNQFNAVNDQNKVQA